MVGAWRTARICLGSRVCLVSRVCLGILRKGLASANHGRAATPPRLAWGSRIQSAVRLGFSAGLGACLAAGGWGHGGGALRAPQVPFVPTQAEWSAKQEEGAWPQVVLRVFERGTGILWSLDHWLNRVGGRKLIDGHQVALGSGGRLWCALSRGNRHWLVAMDGTRKAWEATSGEVLGLARGLEERVLWSLEKDDVRGTGLWRYGAHGGRSWSLPLPGVEEWVPLATGVFAVHPEGALWWIPWDNPEGCHGWPLADGVRAARSLAGSCWVQLDRVGGPWIRVDPRLGPMEGESLSLAGWLASRSETEVGKMLRQDAESRRRGPGRESPSLTRPKVQPAGGSRSARHTPVQRAFRESLGLLPVGRHRGGLWMDWPSPRRSGKGSWLLVASEFLWLLDARGEPMYGQGGFALLQPPDG